MRSDKEAWRRRVGWIQYLLQLVSCKRDEALQPNTGYHIVIDSACEVDNQSKSRCVVLIFPSADNFRLRPRGKHCATT